MIKGLILKERYSMKGYIIFFLCYALFISAIPLVFILCDFDIKYDDNGAAFDITSILILFWSYGTTATFFLSSSLQLDEKNKMNQYLVSVGVDKKAIINSKMILLLPLFAMYSFNCSFFVGAMMDLGIVRVLLFILISFFTISSSCVVVLVFGICISSTFANIFSHLVALILLGIPLYVFIAFYENIFVVILLTISLIVFTVSLYYTAIILIRKREF